MPVGEDASHLSLDLSSALHFDLPQTKLPVTYYRRRRLRDVLRVRWPSVIVV